MSKRKALETTMEGEPSRKKHKGKEPEEEEDEEIESSIKEIKDQQEKLKQKLLDKKRKKERKKDKERPKLIYKLFQYCEQNDDLAFFIKDNLVSIHVAQYASLENFVRSALSFGGYRPIVTWNFKDGSMINMGYSRNKNCLEFQFICDMAESPSIDFNSKTFAKDFYSDVMINAFANHIGDNCISDLLEKFPNPKLLFYIMTSACVRREFVKMLKPWKSIQEFKGLEIDVENLKFFSTKMCRILWEILRTSDSGGRSIPYFASYLLNSDQILRGMIHDEMLEKLLDKTSKRGSNVPFFDYEDYAANQPFSAHSVNPEPSRLLLEVCRENIYKILTEKLSGVEYKEF